MNVAYAVVLHTFSGGSQPKRTVLWRATWFAGVLIGLGYLVWRVTPHGILYRPDMSLTLQTAVLLAIIAACNFAAWLLLYGFQRSTLARLQILQYLPIAPKRLPGYAALAVLPLALIASCITVPLSLAAFVGGWTMELGVQLCVLHIGTLLPALLVGMSGGKVGSWARMIYGGCLALAIVCLQLLLSSKGKQATLAALVTFVYGIVLLLINEAAMHEPVTLVPPAKGKLVHERVRLSLGESMALRAWRNKRYKGAVGFMACVAIGLSGAAYIWPNRLPFDAVVVLCLLLAGTLAQEARSLSKRLHPLELQLFGGVGRFITRVWIISAVPAISCGIVAVAISSFQPVHASVAHMLATCLCLWSSGVLAASVIVPQKGDTAMQIASACLYALLAWAVFKLPDSLWAAPIYIMVCLLCALAAEQRRWMRTIWR